MVATSPRCVVDLGGSSTPSPLPAALPGAQDEPLTGLGAGSTRVVVRRPLVFPVERSEGREELMRMDLWLALPELVAARPALLRGTREHRGLCLHIASFFRPLDFLCVFGGFAMGVLHRACRRLRRPGPPRGGVWQTLASMAPRLDCAVVGLGQGRALMVGGCTKHPSACRLGEFLSSAVIFDGLTNQWTEVPGGMSIRRHGCSGAWDPDTRRAYVLGGEYISQTPRASAGGLLEWFDPETAKWHPGPSKNLALYAFPTFCWLAGRLVVMGQDMLHDCPVAQALNLARPELGWTSVPLPVMDLTATSFTVWRGALVIAGGRGSRSSRSSEAFRFRHHSPEALGRDGWADGSWEKFPDVQVARDGASMCTLNDRVCITGGLEVNAALGHFGVPEFTKSCEVLELGSTSDPVGPQRDMHWRTVDFVMPVGVHAHAAVPLTGLLCPWTEELHQSTGQEPAAALLAAATGSTPTTPPRALT